MALLLFKQSEQQIRYGQIFHPRQTVHGNTALISQVAAAVQQNLAFTSLAFIYKFGIIIV